MAFLILVLRSPLNCTRSCNVSLLPKSRRKFQTPFASLCSIYELSIFERSSSVTADPSWNNTFLYGLFIWITLAILGKNYWTTVSEMCSPFMIIIKTRYSAFTLFPLFLNSFLNKMGFRVAHSQWLLFINSWLNFLHIIVFETVSY